MCNVLDFIDSKDIREYNRETRFTPMEQAVLIAHSRKRMVDEKLAAWKTLLDTYKEEDFEATCHGKRRFSKEKSNWQILSYTITAYETALALQGCSDGVIFEASHIESDFPGSRQPRYFPDYHSALTFIREEKQSYLDDEELRSCETEARIVRKVFGTDCSQDTIYYFDNDLRMIDITPGQAAWSSADCLLDELFVYVPLPFQKGDILRSIRPGKVEYGILCYTPDEQSFSKAIDYGDASDMILSLDQFEPDGERGYFDYCHVPFLWYEKCPNGELPEELMSLFLIQDICLGKLQFNHFLHIYSIHGKNAYRTIYGDKEPHRNRNNTERTAEHENSD